MDKEQEARLDAMYEAWLLERQQQIEEDERIEWLIESLGELRSDWS